LPRHPIDIQQVSFVLRGTENVANAAIRRIDLEHANAKRHWEQIGKPEYLNSDTLAQLTAASQLKTEKQAFVRDGAEVRIEATMPPQSVAAIELFYDRG
jgi:xylan 1,4-beta-xylosidase